MPNSVPYWRLSGFYLFYFASLGVLVPYWGLYLQSLSFDARAIGELMAIIMATKIIAPYIWGWIADHTGKGILIIRIATICSLLAFFGVFMGSGFWWLAIVMALFSFFWNAELPQFEANTMNHLGKDTHKYSVIRLWGSMGFVLSVVGVGILLDSYELTLVPQVMVVLFVAIAISSFLVPEKNTHRHLHNDGPIIQVLKQPVVLALLVVCFLAQLSHGPYYTFYSIFLKQHNYDNSTLGWLWALGVIAEIIVFLYMHRLMPRFGARNLLLVALLVTALRWYLIGHYVDNIVVILFSQCLHAASFGLYHAVTIEMFHRLFKGRHQGRGQALYSSISFGAGGAVGSYISGQYWDQAGATTIFNVAAVVALVAFLIAWKYIHFPSLDKID